MRVLIDTHAFLWFCAGDSALSTRARRAIEDRRNERFLSVASLWEIAIKVSLKKLDLELELELEIDLAELIQAGAVDNGLVIVEVASRHAVGVVNLPFHHCDPFDRILVSQAKVEGLAIVGRDPAFDAYGVKRVW